MDDFADCSRSHRIDLATPDDLYTQEDSDEARAAQGAFLTAVGMTAMVQ
jgi:hypothetical protein